MVSLPFSIKDAIGVLVCINTPLIAELAYVYECGNAYWGSYIPVLPRLVRACTGPLTLFTGIPKCVPA